MKSQLITKGFALLTAVWMVAILSLLSMVTVTSYLGNTRAAQVDLQRIHADLLLEAGIRFAALSLVSPRDQVSANAVPAAELVYPNKISNVVISIANEAGYVDLLAAEPELIDRVFAAANLADAEIGLVRARLQALSAGDQPPSHRQLRKILAKMPGVYQRIINQSTLHSGRRGVNPLLASAEVLKLLPDLPAAKRRNLLASRKQKPTTQFTTPIESAYFSTTASSCYRISAQVLLNGIAYHRTKIVKIINQPGHLFETVATL